MEVLTVDRANLLSSASSSSSLSQQEVATKIKQTHRLTVLLKHCSEQLLAEYVRHQGEPFSSPDFQPPAMAVPGLPSPSIPPEAWLALSDGKRLWHLTAAYATLPGLLGSVRRQQAELNPLASELHRQLEAATRQCLGLAGNLEGIMGALGLPGPPPPSPSLGGPPTSAFLAKLSGYHVCRLHRDWATRSHEALGLLRTKYPL